MVTPIIIREEVQAFIQTFQAFAGFAQNNRLTDAEREAIANIVRTLGLDRKTSLGDAPLTGTLPQIL